METLDRLDGLSGILQRIWFFITLPFVALFSGLYAALSEAGRLFAQGPFRALFGILIFPFLFIFRLTSEARKDLLWCLPAMLAGLCIATLTILTIAQGERIQQRYRVNAATAIRDGDFEKGLVFSQRVLTEKGEVNDNYLQFFQPDQSKEHTDVLQRLQIQGEQLGGKFSTNNEKTLLRFKECFGHNRFTTLIKYFNAMQTFLDIFPEAKTQKGLEQYNKNGKFAWFIDLDTLEVHTQSELIPNGFKKTA